MKKISEKSKKTARNFVNILGVNVASIQEREVLTSVEDFISHNDKFYIVTPNPELILMAQKNKTLRAALNSSDLPIADGVGLKVAAPGLKIIKGRNLFMSLIALAEKREWKVFFLGGFGREANLAAAKLKSVYPKLQIQTFKGPIFDDELNPISPVEGKLAEEAMRKINSYKPNILFVAFNNPKQEIWIHQNLSKLNIGGAMAVGGTFRYVAGMSKLPPIWMETLGLEWLYRLISEPYRAMRVYNAFFVFPLKVLWYRVANAWRAR
jgi:N-acetylglucosaminyldiphosphoundecaprenol N-acetyl-beta-D-mannosaminyltransferase